MIAQNDSFEKTPVPLDYPALSKPPYILRAA